MPEVPIVPSNFERIYTTAWERFLLELARGFAEETERVHVAQLGYPHDTEIRHIELVGEFPATHMKVTAYRPRSESELVTSWPLWRNRDFFDEKLRPQMTPQDMIGEIMMLARGG